MQSAAEQVLGLPDALSLTEGAAVPENFWTVYANLFEPAFGNLLENPAEKTLLGSFLKIPQEIFSDGCTLKI